MNTHRYYGNDPGKNGIIWIDVDLQTMETAPKDGTEIDIFYDNEYGGDAFWSDKPICMLGPRNGTFPPGWATGGARCDRNLPLDPPVHWATYQPAPNDKIVKEQISWTVKEVLGVELNKIYKGSFCTVCEAEISGKDPLCHPNALHQLLLKEVWQWKIQI